MLIHTKFLLSHSKGLNNEVIDTENADQYWPAFFVC